MAGVSRRRAFAVCVAATLVMTVSYIDRQTLAALAPTVRPALGLTHAEYGWITGAFSITYLACALPAGLLVDRFGARRSAAAAVLAWSLVAAGHALVPGFAALFVARVLLGAAEAPSFPAATQTVRRMLPARDRGTGYGLIFTGSSVGGMVVAPLAIALETRLGWRPAFVLVAAFGLSWIPVWAALTSRRAVREKLDAPPTDAPPRRLDRRDAGALARAVVLVLASAPAGLFVFNWYPQVLEGAFQVPQAALGKYLWLPPLFLDVASVVAGVVAGRRPSGEKRDLVLLGGALTLALALAPRAAGPVTADLAGAVGLAGVGVLYSVLTQEVMSAVPPDRVSAAGGVCAAAQSLAYVVAAPIVGRSIDRAHGSYAPAMVGVALCAVPGVFAWVLWPRRAAA